jgi:hypothetical protein
MVGTAGRFSGALDEVQPSVHVKGGFEDGDRGDRREHGDGEPNQQALERNTGRLRAVVRL